jgi:hypothetical protein
MITEEILMLLKKEVFNMEYIKAEIHNKSLELKKKIKELNNILISLYNEQKDKNNKDLYLIKKTAEKFDSASKKIDNIDLSFLENLEKKEEMDMEKLKTDTLKNITILQNFYKNKLKDDINKTASNKIPKIKRNLDNLNLAFNDLSRIDVSFTLKSKDYEI